MQDGTEITAEIIAGLSPYRTAHINRFGDYILDMNRQALRPDYRIEVLTKPNDHE